MVIADEWSSIQPSLLDRLTDDEPCSTSESKNLYGLSLRQVKAMILRDASWLLNATQLGATVDLRSYPHVAASTLNYGVRPLAGPIVDGLDATALGQDIVDCLQCFEPRLLADSVKVTPLTDANQNGSLGFRIEADLWAEPMPLRLVMRTDLDRDLKNVSIVELVAETI
ncbi:type VI secretion system baseplate subunit TssE (plasmid) [Sinorhizobium medicae]|uniref:type VI secretion system baseplate subunit TssE n=1 Tax=Rhizobiaceae TaxID=82115 RepID=UPI001CD633D7|nr:MULTISPECIES: type VI secretion system baseplate subunit TssE [Rhizobiaceae]MCA0804313.1 type VI secretion system baseplate subunit TssE [Rhizobium sp. T1473]WQO48336.1 type VI secretion system baseplate subunit TssE [Sinorhizobium medicae]WQO68752.1 type VI secretion system baseplate subunit TssE [Sinorhizobium medicae]WQO75789.1 type VI secretion system baseplate subunit TssE [Sinorhizobium medicae]WQO94952.1 type VI secretion system baseplate subunit TssE [Sinorhizobium medicae]